MKQESPVRYKRYIKTPSRKESPVGVLTKGLDFTKESEKTDQQCISECDGFIVYSGVLKKDWNVIDSANVACDNITITAAASVEVCSA